MASFTIKRDTLTNINATPIVDGQVLFTTNQTYDKIYADVGSIRRQIGGQQTVDTVLSTSSPNPIANSAVSTELFYKAGDTYTLASTIPIMGEIVNNQTYCIFGVPVAKSLANINTITFACTSLTMRLPAGGYAFQNYDAANFPSISIIKSDNNFIRVQIQTGAFAAPNNSIVGLNGTMVFTFS